jgi:hypothetical protein
MQLLEAEATVGAVNLNAAIQKRTKIGRPPGPRPRPGANALADRVLTCTAMYCLVPCWTLICTALYHFVYCPVPFCTALYRLVRS